MDKEEKISSVPVVNIQMPEVPMMQEKEDTSDSLKDDWTEEALLAEREYKRKWREKKAKKNNNETK